LGINLTAINGVNFNSVSDATLETLVKYRFRRLTISIDGATPATYREYRKGGEFDRVIANVEKLNQYKRQHASRYPILTWQFVIFGHNEHELVQARALARELKMNFSAKLNTETWGTQYSPVKNRELVSAGSALGVASVGEFREKYQREYLIPCQELWLSPQINWDGKLLGCCVNVWGDYGNAFESGLDGCVASEKYAYAQKMLLGEAPTHSDIPCAECSFYKNHALKNLLEATFTGRIAQQLMSAKVAGGNHQKLTTAVGRFGVLVFDASRRASTGIRKFRAGLVDAHE
jgi:MoaA/NifB/PqqE/SkfB family radical SAM enzyme